MTVGNAEIIIHRDVCDDIVDIDSYISLKLLILPVIL
jgi:hypothetical protein